MIATISAAAARNVSLGDDVNVSLSSDVTMSLPSDVRACGKPSNVSLTMSLTTSLTMSLGSDTTPYPVLRNHRGFTCSPTAYTSGPVAAGRNVERIRHHIGGIR